jgi:hypothetical protein
MSGTTKKKKRKKKKGRRSYHWINVDRVGCHERWLRSMSVILCYESKYLTWNMKSNLSHVYMNYWAPSPRKPFFNGMLRLRFVSHTQNTL